MHFLRDSVHLNNQELDLFKKIKEYGVLKISDITKQSINSLKNFTLSLDHNYEKSNEIVKKSESGSSVIDYKLLTPCAINMMDKCIFSSMVS